jgi:hypothetical protein
MTEEEHRARHQELHQALDELLADWIGHQSIDYGKVLSDTTLMELMRWSHEQTINPTPLPGSLPHADTKH